MFKIFNKQEILKENKTIVKDIVPESKYLLTKEEVFKVTEVIKDCPPLSKRDTEIVKFIHLVSENLDNLIINELNDILVKQAGIKIVKTIHNDSTKYELNYNIIKLDKEYRYFELSFKRNEDECSIWLFQTEINKYDNIFSLLLWGTYSGKFTIDNYFNQFKNKFLLDNHIYEFFVIFKKIFNIKILYEDNNLVVEKSYSENDNYDIFETY